MDLEYALQYMDNTEPARLLCKWFLENARRMPWRDDPTPYNVWISEIMLQQTRVEAVKPYYKRFMETLPNVSSLADCPEEKYNKLWEGLGYYSRIRNLNAAAKQIEDNYGGEIPDDYDALLTLKGIGSYTAGAIASSAFGLPYPAVDGNVLRVLMRLLGCDWDIAQPVTKKYVEQMVLVWLGKIDEIFEDLPPGKLPRTGTLNQALMELGALVCVPNGAPHCEVCPWNKKCVVFADDNWESIPVKTPKKPRKVENKTVIVLQSQAGVFFHKRPDKGLLAGLYEFPNAEGELSSDEVIELVKQWGYSPIRIRPIEGNKHIFTHVEWHMSGYEVLIEEPEQTSTPHVDRDGFIYIDVETARNQYAVPAAFRKFKQFIGMETN